MAIRIQHVDMQAITKTRRPELRQAPSEPTTAPPDSSLPPAFTAGYLRGDPKSPLTCPPQWTASIVSTQPAAWGCCNTQAECNAFWGECIPYGESQSALSTSTTNGSPTNPASPLFCSSGEPSCKSFISSTAADDPLPATSYGCGLVALAIPVLAEVTSPQNTEIPSSTTGTQSTSSLIVSSSNRMPTSSTLYSAPSGSSETSTNSRHNSLSKAHLAGIVVGVVLPLVILVCGYCLWRKQKTRRIRQQTSRPDDRIPQSSTIDVSSSNRHQHVEPPSQQEVSDIPAGLQARRRQPKVAIICALVVESNSVLEAMDETWDDYEKADRDGNRYTHGLISGHEVVLVYSPGSGQTTTGISVRQLHSLYPEIRLALVVGVCGGVPTAQESNQIFLGDLIVSTSTVTVDFGRQHDSDLERYDTTRNPRDSLTSFLQMVQGRKILTQLRLDLMQNLRAIQQKRLEDKAEDRGIAALTDRLFEASYLHKHRRAPEDGYVCECQRNEDVACRAARDSDCISLGCDSLQLVQRDSRTGRYDSHGSFNPRIHFGCVASGNALMRSGLLRDKIARKEKVIAFEMEGAAVYQVYQNTIIIKAACDYADSHKSKAWQPYAADVAAAGMKALLKVW